MHLIVDTTSRNCTTYVHYIPSSRLRYQLAMLRFRITGRHPKLPHRERQRLIDRGWLRP